MLDLRRLGIGVREVVNRIEQAVIDTLGTWNPSIASIPAVFGVCRSPRC
jgi:lipoyl(octanoyl) transferase